MNKKSILLSLALWIILVSGSLWSGTSWYNDICNQVQQGQTNNIPPYTLGLRDSGFENCSINRLIINPFIYLPGFFLVLTIVHAYMVVFQKKQTVGKNLIFIMSVAMFYYFLTCLIGYVFPYIYSNPLEGQFVSIHKESVFAAFSLNQNLFLVIPIAVLIFAYSQIGIVSMALLYKRFFLNRGYKPNLITLFCILTGSLFIQGLFVLLLTRSYVYLDSINRPKVTQLSQSDYFVNAPTIKNNDIQATIAPVSLSEWKTYENIKMGIKFKYPNDWKTEEDKVSIKLYPSGYSPGSYFTISEEPSDFPTFLNKIEKNIGYKFYPQTEYLGRDKNIKVESLFLDTMKGGQGYYYIYHQPNNILITHGYNDSGSLESVGAILSTIHFLDNIQTIGIENWITYKSSENLFSFQYPDDGDWKIIEYDLPVGKSVSVVCEKCLSSTISNFEVSPVNYKSNEDYISIKKGLNQVMDYIITEFGNVTVLRTLQPGAPSKDAHTEIFTMNDEKGYVVSETFINQGNKTKITDLPTPYPNIFATFKLN